MVRRILGLLMALCALGAAVDNDPLAAARRPAVSSNLCPPNVWVTGSLAKVGPEALPGALHVAEISAARNEFESFQIHVRASRPRIQMDLTVSDFTGSSGGHIGSAANVAVFRESYVRIRQVSDLNGMGGFVPDALIPVRDSIFHELRNAFPVMVPSGQTRSAWIEVFVPPSTPSGYYSSTVIVKDGASILARIPVLLKVWDFELPSTSSLKSAFGMSYGSLAAAAYKDQGGAGKFPGANGDPEKGLALSNVAVAAFFLDHRITISEVVAGVTPRGDWMKFDQLYGPLLDGSAGTILKGARLTSLKYPKYGPLDSDDLRDWMSHFRKKRWNGLFDYVCDEPPSGCSWAQLADKIAAYRAVAPGVPSLVTTNIDKVRGEGVLDLIDILAAPVNDVFESDRGDRRSDYDRWLKQSGKEIWWYQCCNQHQSCANGTSGPRSSTWPSYMIDATPVRNRVFQWMAYLNRVDGELYYQTDLWGEDPWDHLYDFGGNGDGALFYPGTVDKIGGHHPTAVASIRLKLIRDGMEDYEYLHALEQQGHGDFARKVAHTFIQNVLTFSNSPEALLSAREQLGAELHALARRKTMASARTSLY